MLFDTNYLASFYRPNVSLYSAVEEIAEDGLITSNGKLTKSNTGYRLTGCNRREIGF
jgi:hypothetical protein